MGDVKELIKTILSDSKLIESRSIQSKIYADEPIIKTAAQMDGFLPPKYREMRALAKGCHDQSSPELFYKQGKFMADFEDDFDYHGLFFRYFPTYQSMNDLQLRGYFSWRTKVRRGTVEETSLSFVFTYIYELLNLIGVEDAAQGYEVLRSFWTEYRSINSSIDRYVRQWLGDFAVYYNLDKALLDDLEESAADNALMVLFDCASHSEDEIFAALGAFSSYNLEKSKFFKEYPEDLKSVACAVFCAMNEYTVKNRKNSLCEKLFGRIYSGPYYMFRSAVFYDRIKYESLDYTVNEIHKYSCRNGNWRCSRFYGARGKNQQLGAMLKAIDRHMRERYSFSSPLQPGRETKILQSTIEKEIDRYLENKKKSTAPKIEIDVSKLSGIRLAALETQSRLIVEEEAFDLSEAPPEIDPPGEAEQEAVMQEEFEAPLDEIEYEALRRLLYGGEYASFIASGGRMLSVVVDSINEKLFDMLGDTAIVFDGEAPVVLEDYEEELKGIIKK